METREIIKERRLELRLTMKEVADHVGVSEATVSRWEKGEIANMKRDKIVKLAEQNFHSKLYTIQFRKRTSVL